MLLVCLTLLVFALNFISCESKSTPIGNDEQTSAISSKETILTSHIHTIMIDKAVLPTCTDSGVSEGMHCLTCGTVLIPQEIISPTGHLLEKWEEKLSPTCTENGQACSKCSRCGNLETKIINALGHAYNIWTQTMSPTCTENGSEFSQCFSCGYIETREITALGHKYGEWVQTLSPTCTQKGSSQGKCLVCNLNETVIIQELGHRYEHKVVSPTNKTDGYTLHTCPVCGDSYQDSVIPAIGSLGLNYSILADGATCAIMNIGACTDTEVYIPTIIDGYKVTAIADYAFAENSAITFIKIPNTVTTIGDRAFYKCTSITEFTIPESVTDIGLQVFDGCEKLTTAYYNCPYGDRNNPFLSVQSLKKIVFGGLTVPNYVAYGNPYLETVVISETVESISAYAFCGCSALKNVEFADNSNLKIIRDKAFFNCNALEEIKLPNGLQKLQQYQVFGYCEGLKRVTIPSTLVAIGWESFIGCPNVTDIYLTDIEAWNTFMLGIRRVFSNYDNLHILDNEGNEITEIAIPDKTLHIGISLLQNCTTLESLIIPAKVLSIGGNALAGCINLTSITYKGTIEQWNAIALGNNWNAQTLVTEIKCSNGAVTLN